MPRYELTFLTFLQTFRRGELVAEIEARLSEVLTAVGETGDKGEITLKLPFRMNKAGQIDCTPQLTSKTPRRPIGTGIYYVTDEGRLSRRDPAQDDMFDDELEARRSRGTDH